MKDANGIPQNSPKFPKKRVNGLKVKGLRFYIVIFWPFLGHFPAKGLTGTNGVTWAETEQY